MYSRKRQRRTEEGIYGRDRAHESSGKPSECFEFSWLLDHNKAASSDHRVRSSWRLASLASKQEKSGITGHTIICSIWLS